MTTTYTPEQLVAGAGAEGDVAAIAALLERAPEDELVLVAGATVLRRGRTYRVAWQRFGGELVNRRLGADAEGGASTAPRTRTGIEYVSEPYAVLEAARWIWMESNPDAVALAAGAVGARAASLDRAHETYRAAILEASTLDELREALVAADEDLRASAEEEHLNVSDLVGVAYDELPTFGGDVPRDTAGVFSWDSERLLVFDGGWALVNR